MRPNSLFETLVYAAAIVLAVLALVLVISSPHFLSNNHAVYQGF